MVTKSIINKPGEPVSESKKKPLVLKLKPFFKSYLFFVISLKQILRHILNMNYLIDYFYNYLLLRRRPKRLYNFAAPLLQSMAPFRRPGGTLYFFSQ